MADPLWSLICLAGVWGFIACAVLLLLTAFPARDCLDRQSAVRWGGGAVVCFVLWIVAMTKA